MATFKQYTKKDGSKLWLFQSYIGTDETTGKQKYTTRRGFKTKKEAQIALNKILLEVEANGFTEKRITTFEQLYEQWMPIYRNKVKPSTVASTIEIFKLYVLPHFAKLKLDKINVSYCQQVLEKWFEKYRGYKNFKMKTSMLFDYAVSLELIPSNPMAKTQTPRQKEKEKPINFYTKKQLLEFLSLYKVEGDFMKYVFFHLLAYTGLRKSEALSLQYSDINFLKSELTVGKTVAINEHKELIIQTPKTSNSYRTISLDPATLNLLKQWKHAQSEIYFKLGYKTNKLYKFIDTP